MRLLVVEDEKQLAEALGEILRLNKYSIDIVHNGLEALDYLGATQYDGVILDIMLPKLDGISVLKCMRENNNMTPVLLLSAKGEIDDRVLGLDSGADDYLSKPFATKELLARLRSITRRTAELATTNLEFGNILLDRTSYELCGNNHKIPLTNKEYQLIEMLFRNIGKHLSSEYFMDQIWGYDSDSEINVVWAHISTLRRKLNDLDANISIKSSRNLGYSLVLANGN